MSDDERGRHMFAEATSRYDLRCIRCGCSALNPRAKEPCPARPRGANEPAIFDEGARE